MNLDARILELASSHQWMLTRSQALDAGLTPRMIDHRIAIGRWQLIREGTYLVLPGRADTPALLEAAVASLRGAVVSHESAGDLHRLYVPSGLAVVTAALTTTHKFPGVIIHRVNDLEAEHITDVDALPVTTLDRTIIDLAAVLSFQRLEWVVNDALAAGRISLESFRELFESLAGRGKPGTASLRRVLEDQAPGFGVARTVIERLLARVIDLGGLPQPVWQFRLPWWTEVEGVSDGAYVEEQVMVEADGRRWHTRKADFERDRKRDNAAARHHWRVLRFTYHMLKDNPTEVVATIREALRRRP